MKKLSNSETLATQQENKKKQILKTIHNFLTYHPEKEYDFTLEETSKENSSLIACDEISNQENKKKQAQNIFSSLDVNLEYIKTKYNSMINSDVVIRNFTLIARNKQYRAFLIYIDGMVDSTIINDFILEPLMLRNRANIYDSNTDQVVLKDAIASNITVRKVKRFDLANYILNCLLPQNSLTKSVDFDDIISGINSGNCGLFIDTISTAFNIEVKGFKQRSVDTPKNEVVIRGSQEAFTEVIRTNTSMLRRLVNNENLIIENIEVGSLSKTKCAVCYMKDIANNDLVAEVKYRLNNLEVDYLLSSGQLEQLIEDKTNSTLPQVLATERPDKATNYLLGGRVVVIVNGSPYVLIMPGVFIDFVSSPEDINLKYQYSNLLKLIRIIGILITLLLPGFYVAITNFHQELIPTELLFAIVASRESVPFPIISEIVIMELSFELIREAGIRVPSPVGPTIGIVGALVLGQAAVEASIVSPILIIVVAITAIASFVIPDYSLGFHFRIARFAYIMSGYLWGFLGISLTLFLHLALLISMKSFGVPYLAPYAPITKKASKGYFLEPIWKRERRSDFLNTKKPCKQETISRKWKYPNIQKTK